MGTRASNVHFMSDQIKYDKVAVGCSSAFCSLSRCAVYEHFYIIESTADDWEHFLSTWCSSESWVFCWNSLSSRCTPSQVSDSVTQRTNPIHPLKLRFPSLSEQVPPLKRQFSSPARVKSPPKVPSSNHVYCSRSRKSEWNHFIFGNYVLCIKTKLYIPISIVLKIFKYMVRPIILNRLQKHRSVTYEYFAFPWAQTILKIFPVQF